MHPWGWGPGAGYWGGISGVLNSLWLVSPMGCKQRHPSPTSHPDFSKAPGTETAPVGGEDMPVGMCALPCLGPDPRWVFSSLQEMVYQATTKSLIKGVISGFNATVFAYGPTGERERAVCPCCPLEEQAPCPPSEN